MAVIARYRVVELGLVVVVGDELPDGAAPGTVLAAAADLRSPMTVGRRWPVAGGDPGAGANTMAVRWLLRERAEVLEGPPARALVAEVTASALRAEALGEARALAEAWEDDPEPYAEAWPARVLTACRVLHTAATATVVGEPDAARWALDVPALATHHPVIDAALGGPTPGTDLGLGSRALVWDVVRWAGEHALGAREVT